jgi:transposase
LASELPASWRLASHTTRWSNDMTKVAEIERIRWAHFREGISIRELAHTFHHSRRTIRRALADPGPWGYRRERPPAEPVMGPVAEVVKRWLEEDLQRPRKQRHTAKRIWERLVAEYGFSGGQSTVRQWVRRHRPTSTRAVTLPLAHDPGAGAQIDFGEATVRLAGRDTVVQLFCARLAYSTRDVVRAYERQDRSAWLDGHVHAFQTWGGAPATCWYDNASQLGHREKGRFVPCDEFVALQSAFRFRARHCNPGEAHEKGLVEGLVGYARRAFLVPVPEVADLDQLNRYLEECTAAEEGRRRQGRTASVGELFREERPLLAPLPRHPFLACTRHPVKAIHDRALVSFERRRYSVPVEHAGQRLWLRAFSHHIEVWTSTACVARHPRRPGPGEPITDFWHYLPVLLRKAGAFRQALPVRQAHFPEEAQALLWALETRHGDDLRRAHREFLAAYALYAAVEPVRWRAACATALARGEVSAAGVRAALEGSPPPSPTASVLPPALAEVRVSVGDLSQYNRLLGA